MSRRIEHEAQLCFVPLSYTICLLFLRYFCKGIGAFLKRKGRTVCQKNAFAVYFAYVLFTYAYIIRKITDRYSLLRHLPLPFHSQRRRIFFKKAWESVLSMPTQNVLCPYCKAFDCIEKKHFKEVLFLELLAGLEPATC